MGHSHDVDVLIPRLVINTFLLVLGQLLRIPDVDCIIEFKSIASTCKAPEKPKSNNQLAPRWSPSPHGSTNCPLIHS